MGKVRTRNPASKYSIYRNNSAEVLLEEVSLFKLKRKDHPHPKGEKKNLFPRALCHHKVLKVTKTYYLTWPNAMLLSFELGR